MNKKFQKGDLVKLKSGSPIMTVEGYDVVCGIGSSNHSVSVHETDDVKCVWFEGTEQKRESFNQEALILVKEEVKL